MDNGQWTVDNGQCCAGKTPIIGWGIDMWVCFFDFNRRYEVVMRAGWEMKKLGEVCQTGSGGTPLKSKREYYEGGLIPWILSGEVAQGDVFGAKNCISQKGLVNSSAKIFPVNTVLVAMYGATAGQVGILRFEAATNQAVCGIFPNKRFIPEFLFYFLLSRKDELVAQAEGNAQPNISQLKIKNTDVPLPPLPEQQRIVAILDEAFEGIATVKANAEKNLKNARALFDSYLNSVFSRRGEGWVEKTFGHVCGFVRGPFGGSLKKSIFVEDGYAVYEQQHAIYDQFDDVRYFIDEKKFKEMKRFELRPNDLIMSCSGTMGRVAIVPEGIRQGIINQALLKLTPTAKVSGAFLKFWMESQVFQDALKEYAGGAAIQNVASVKILKEIKVFLPSIKEQERIIEELDALHEETQRLESIYQKKILALDALKKSILHQAFTGAL
jgi:type I restriction enzyme S subunit